MSSEDLKDKYNVVDEDEPEPEEYLTKETLINEHYILSNDSEEE